MRYLAAGTIGLIFLASAVTAQVRTPPPIPSPEATDAEKVETCAQSISDELGWQVGPAKRLREWCRTNGFITYEQQLKAEGVPLGK